MSKITHTLHRVLMSISTSSPLAFLMMIQNEELFLSNFSKYKICFWILVCYLAVGIIFINLFLRRIKQIEANKDTKKAEKVPYTLSLQPDVLDMFINLFPLAVLASLMSFYNSQYSLNTCCALFVAIMFIMISNSEYSNLYLKLLGYHVYSFKANDDETYYIFSKKNMLDIKNSNMYAITNGGALYYAD